MCWLCRNQGCKIPRKMTEFIINNIGYADFAIIGQQVSDYVLLKEPMAQNVEPHDVVQHIRTHMLHPRVRTAVILRQMLDFAALLQENMVVHDGPLCTVDKGNAELYLKVITHITALYKVDPQTMLFADDALGMSEPTLDASA